MGVWIIRVLCMSLASTLVLEEGFGFMLGIRDRWDMVLIGLVNLLTNPAVVLLYYVNGIYIKGNQTAVTILLEFTAVLAEGLCYKAAARGIRHLWVFAIGANLFSYTAGVVLSALI